jgi:hypothetical protein
MSSSIYLMGAAVVSAVFIFNLSETAKLPLVEWRRFLAALFPAGCSVNATSLLIRGRGIVP